MFRTSALAQQKYKNPVKPIAHSPLEWPTRHQIPDWSLVEPLTRGLGFLILTIIFGKFNIPSITCGPFMKGASGRGKGSLKWDFAELPEQIVWLPRCLLGMNVCTSVRIFSDTFF